MAAITAVPLGAGLARAQGSRSARETLVQALESTRAGDCGSAEPLLRQVISLQPFNVAARRLLGRCLLDAGRWDEARPQFEALLGLAPDDAGALSGLRAALAAGQRVESARQVEQIESRRTRAEQLTAQYEMRDAEALLADGRKVDAEQALLAILTKRPEEIAAAVRLAELYSSTRRFVEAARLFDRLSQGPDVSSQHSLRAAQNFEWGADDAAAVLAYRRFLEKEKGSRTVRTALGRALIRLGRCGEAVGELTTVAGRDGSRADSAPVALDLARCYDRLREPDLALATYESVTRLDPRLTEAQNIVAQRRRDAEEAPLRRAYAAIELKDNETAVRELSAYLEAQPGNTAARLQLARILSWASRFESSAAAYAQYLKARPDDSDARRELAQVLAWRGLTAESIHQYHTLAGAAGTPEDAIPDLEAVLRLQLQAGDLDGGNATAQSLLKVRPGHEEASRVVTDAAARRRTAARETAQTLTAEGRYVEAIEAYRRYEEEYGAEPEIGLLVARLHSWTRDNDGAISSYRAYLSARPDDAAARSELAAVLTWAERTADAEREYETILEQNPLNVNAALRLTQIRDRRGEDPVEMVKAYEVVLRLDAESGEARARAKELRREVAPRPRLVTERFTDSDDLIRLSTTAEVSILRHGKVSFAPIAGYLRSEQGRAVVGQTVEVAALNAEISRRSGRAEGGGLGLRVAASPGSWRVTTEALVLRFDTGRTSVNGRADFFLENPSRFGVGLQYLRREGVYDLASGATLIAGIMGNTAMASAWRAFGPSQRDGGPPIRAWVAAGATFYSASSDGAFPENRQDRLSTRLTWDIRRSASLTYAFRYSGFERRSPIYYSPARDTVHLLSASLSTEKPRFRAALTLEAGRENINDEKVMPFLIQPEIEWKLTPRFPLRLSYRYARSAASSFGSSSYLAQTIELSLGSRR